MTSAGQCLYVYQIFIFQYPSKFTYINTVHDAAIVAIAMHAVPSRRTGDRCMRAAHKSGTQKRHELLCRQFRTESKYVRITANALTAASWHARHGQRVRRLTECVRIAAKCCALTGWPAVAETIKGVETTDRLHLWGAWPGKDGHDRLEAGRVKKNLSKQINLQI